MADTDELQTLQAEIASLTERLATAEAHNQKSGELGLELLAKNAQLKTQQEQLQREYDHAKEELENTREELNKVRRNAALSEYSREESLLEDKEKLEADFMARITQSEAEVKKLREELDETTQENDCIQVAYNELTTKMSEVEEQRNELRQELRDLRDREQRLLNDNSELEEENITLQRQVSTLKSAQVEYEAMKMEVTRIVEDNEILQAAVEEHRHLIKIAEDATEQALSTAQQEREQRLKMKREYEHQRHADQINSLNSLYVGINDAQQQNDQDRLTALHTSLMGSEALGGDGESGGTDLYSELHGTELASLKSENERLATEMEEFRSTIGRALTPLLQKFQISGLSESGDLGNLKDIIHEAIGRLDERLKTVGAERGAEKRVEQLKTDLRKVILLAGTRDAQLRTAQERVVHLAEAVAQFTSELAAGDSENAPEWPRLQQLQVALRSLAEQNIEKEESKRTGADSPPQANGDDENAERDARSPRLHTPGISRSLISSDFAREIEAKLHAGLRLEEIINETDRRERLAEETEPVVKTFDTFHELVKLLRVTTDRIAQTRVQMIDKDKAELIQQISKFKQLLHVKREQVSSLRTVLRSNKTCNENALNSVRSKYQSEMKIKDETISQLRRELKQFKEDAATFASNRALYTARNEELKAQIDQLNEKLVKSQTEHEIVGALLRTSIKQKLDVTQRLEDLEMDRERHVQTSKRPLRSAVPQRDIKAVRYPAPTQGTGGPPRPQNSNSPRGNNDGQR
ncbi:hypothetical protein M3Y94_00992500 [Aphelenchoides besseyi]|nr:hypothetical protein M3Y94_00992500 [Aphelenchoides besseyi]KAI6221159.1 hypothetical protein M3Y95_01011200 [Aphelenchoides besseyi]